MATCKECIHDNACVDLFRFFGCTGDYNNHCVEKECKHFKNKVNVIEVIRCANCKHRKKNVFRAVDNLVYWQCEKHDIEILLTDFCSCGEREKRG